MRTTFLILISLLVIVTFASAQERDTPPQQRGVFVEAATENDGGFISAGREISGKKYAVLVGITEYQNMKKLDFTKNDAEALRDQLVNIGFAPQNIRTLTNGNGVDNEPTKDNIEKAIEGFLKRAGKNDLVIISLSGHGIQPANLGPLFCLPDVDPIKDRDHLKNTTISINKIRDDMGDCKASFKLLLVDACRNDPFGLALESHRGVKTILVSHSSGENIRDIAFKGVSLEGVDTTAPLENLTVFQSCSDGQVSWEDGTLGGQGHGLFTYYIIEALKGGAADNDGNVELMALMTHATRETLRHSQNDARMTEQRPKMFFNGNDFVLANIRNPNRPNLEIRQEIQRLTTLDLPQQPQELPPKPDGIEVTNDRELRTAISNLRDGGVIILKPGVYNLTSHLNITPHLPNYRAKAPIVFYGDPKDPQNVQIRIRNGKININNRNAVLIGLDISSANDGGIQVDGEAKVEIAFCSIRDCKGDGIYNRSQIFVDSSVITGNGTGFQSGLGGRSDVNNSRIAYNKGYGVTVTRTSKGRFSDNILFENGNPSNNTGGNWRVVGNVQNQ